MGANFQIMSVPGDVSEAQLQSIFHSEQDRDRHENGHEYSGGFGMATGLTVTQHSFATRDEAYDWLDKNVEKWENALAVRYQSQETGKHMWLIGALCAS